MTKSTGHAVWPYPFTVWEGERNGAAHGRGYRRRWAAIVAAWWANLYSGQDVWIERAMPNLRAAADRSE
jgi:hypothetical protein